MILVDRESYLCLYIMFVIQEGKTAAVLCREAGYDSLAEYLEGSVSKVASM